MRPRDFTASRSEASSATEASIFSREKSLMSTPWMISQAPPLDETGNELIRPSGTPYEPSETTAAEVQEVPFTQSWTWSIAALAAEAAEDAPRASMMAAPRLATVGMNSPASHSWSTWSAALRPLTWVVYRSGYWVAEWLPQIVMCSIAVTGTDSLVASWVSDRVWSSRV